MNTNTNETNETNETNKAEAKFEKAGKIAVEIARYAKKIVGPEILLLEIAEAIEEKIFSLAAPAFPVDLSINEIAAHYSPSFDDKSIARDLLKIDFGVSVDGYIVDMALSFDLTPEEKYKDLIRASNEALKAALKIARYNVEIREIGKIIDETIKKYGFVSVKNLSGHKIERYNLHAGLAIPNYDNNDNRKLDKGIYAIEPFATSGEGFVKNSVPSGIYVLKEKKLVRGKEREVLEFIEKNYRLPFASRWINKNFFDCSLYLNILEKVGCLYQYPVLVERSGKEVSQTEHTIAVEEKRTKILTAED